MSVLSFVLGSLGSWVEGSYCREGEWLEGRYCGRCERQE